MNGNRIAKELLNELTARLNQMSRKHYPPPFPEVLATFDGKTIWELWQRPVRKISHPLPKWTFIDRFATPGGADAYRLQCIQEDHARAEFYVYDIRAEPWEPAA